MNLRRISLLAALLMLAAVPSAYADGTETLGNPSVAINASATRVLAGGVGMSGFVNAPNSFSVNVPAGATVRQVLLYWSGHFSTDNFIGSPDDTVSVNGNSVTGTAIGGPAFFFQAFGSLENFITYRSDITALNLVAPGSNSLTISNMAFSSVFGAAANDGAGVLVLYSDPADPAGSSVAVRDGLDLAFSGFPAPRDTTVPQTFTFASSAVARTANLASLASSVSNFDPTFGFRTNQLRVTFNLGGTGDVTIDNPYQSNAGAEYDASNIAITVPAGASQMTVQALSGGPGPSPSTPASFAWSASAVSIPGTPPPPPPPPSEGCTPGYWKNHTESWPPSGYSPSQLLSSVFSNTGSLGSNSLLTALGFPGGNTLDGKKQILLRAAVASLLNAAHPGVDFDLTAAQVIASVNAALASNNKDTIIGLATQLDNANNGLCRLN